MKDPLAVVLEIYFSILSNLPHSSPRPLLRTPPHPNITSLDSAASQTDRDYHEHTHAGLPSLPEGNPKNPHHPRYIPATSLENAKAAGWGQEQSAAQAEAGPPEAYAAA